MTEFTHDEILRYSRHLIMPEVTLDGQRRLKAARVLCVGAGGLGSPLSLYLAAAGVGTLGLADFDTVDLTNIQRQILYATADVGRAKLDAAQERISALNPSINMIPHDAHLSSDNAMAVVGDYDIVVDGTDNFATRYLINDACVLARKPNVYASVFRFEGQISVFDAARGPCYRCLFPEPPPPGLVPSCADGGVLGVLPGIMGSLQALEVIKLILGEGDPMIGRMLHFDALAFEFHELKLDKDPDCVVCGETPSITAPIDYDAFCNASAVPGATGVQYTTAHELHALMQSGQACSVIDVREPHEFDIAQIPDTLRIPLGELPAKLERLDTAQHYTLTCHRGPRSIEAYELMRAAGFQNLTVLAGGVDAWAEQIDPSMARY